jgi:hypothetical protein
VDPLGSGERKVASSCVYGDEHSDSGATEIVSQLFSYIKAYRKKKTDVKIKTDDRMNTTRVK